MSMMAPARWRIALAVEGSPTVDTTLGAFVDANLGALGPREVSDIIGRLEQGRDAVIGGGAMPMVVIHRLEG